MERLSRILVIGGGTAALALATACGSDSDAPKLSMVPAKPSARQAAKPNADNRPPVIERVVLRPARPLPGDTVEAVVEARDPDGDAIRLRYDWSVNRRSAGSGSTLGGRPLGKDDRIEVTVVATDGFAESSPMTRSARVENQAPEMTDVTLHPSENVLPGDELTALVDANDADEESLRYVYVWLVNGKEVREKGRTFSTEGLKRDDRVEVRVSARDADETSRPMTSPAVQIANSPPEIGAIPKAEQDGETFRYRFEADDPDGDRSLRWSLTEAPAGMSIDPVMGVAMWRPSEDQTGTQIIEVQVADRHGDGSKLRFEVTVSSVEKPAEQPPASRSRD
jgi:hypothetical protein